MKCSVIENEKEIARICDQLVYNRIIKSEVSSKFTPPTSYYPLTLFGSTIVIGARLPPVLRLGLRHGFQCTVGI